MWGIYSFLAASWLIVDYFFLGNFLEHIHILIIFGNLGLFSVLPGVFSAIMMIVYVRATGKEEKSWLIWKGVFFDVKGVFTAYLMIKGIKATSGNGNSERNRNKGFSEEGFHSTDLDVRMTT